MGYKIKSKSKKRQPEGEIAPTFEAECDALEELATLDIRIFETDGKVSQDLCNFVLALALIYNDFKDILHVNVILKKVKPTGSFIVSRTWGAYSGMEWHLFRLISSILHELFKLIESNQELLSDPFFKGMLRRLPSPVQSDWRTLVDIALGAKRHDKVGRILLLIRNKVASHYDLKCISTGYEKHFRGSSAGLPGIQDYAFASIGSTMRSSRFYFADAAAQGYLRSIFDSDSLDKIMMEVFQLLDPFNVALLNIVSGFIQARGYPTGRYREQGLS